MMLACAGVIGASIAASFFVVELYDGVADLGRIQFSGDLLDTETDSSEPVNFLIIGVDSALGLDPDDPAAFGRDVDARGNSLADTIALLRIDPVGGQAWMLTLPRDLLVEIPNARIPVQKINAASLIGGAPLLVETVWSTNSMACRCGSRRRRRTHEPASLSGSGAVMCSTVIRRCGSCGPATIRSSATVRS
jgi:anionic cell wall polymer biosynthesis LytR-Cps2A-Psr (LCP) family protein